MRSNNNLGEQRGIIYSYLTELLQTYPAMVIESIDTFITTSAVFAELTNLQEQSIGY